MAAFQPSEMRSIPDAITTSAANALQAMVLALVPDIKSFYPPLMFSYATGTRKAEGTREADAKGTGPGLVFAAQLALRFHKAGVPCFTGLHVPEGEDWKIYYPRLDSRFSKCTVFIVLLTAAFYQSKNCLQEVATALRAKKVTKIIPVRMEEGLPGVDDQWPMIEADDTENVQRLTEVQRELGKLNAFPARGTLFSDPAYLGQLLEKVMSELGLPAPAVEMGDAGGGGGGAAGAAHAADEDERARRAVAATHQAGTL